MAEDSTTSTETIAPVWLRWVMPSGADLFFVVLLGALAFTPLSVRLLGDAGIGWHIRTGQQILATHAIPRVDPFSSTMQGQPWFAWEWLYDVVAGRLESGLGLNGVVWLTAVVLAAVFGLLFRLLMRRGTHIFAAVILVLLAVSASMIHFLARPHVVSWLFTLIWFAILDGDERRAVRGSGRASSARRRLWMFPLLMVVWVNLHGGFLVGFILLAIFWLGAVWRFLTADANRIEDALQKIAARQRALVLAAVGLVSLAASLVNPYGWNLYRHIYVYLSNRFLMNHIDEFRSPDFHGAAQKCFLALLLITVAVLAARGRELRLSGVLTILFAVYAGLYASRNIPVSSLLLAIVIGPLAGVSWGERFSEKMTAVECSLRGHLWPILATVLTFVIAANGGRLGSSTLMEAHFDPKRMPVAAIDFLSQRAARGPVLTTDSWGGYVIYRMYPQARVVLDDRHDLYGEKFFKAYLKMERVEPGWEEFLRDHPAEYVVLPRESALTMMLLATGKRKQLYGDDVAVVFDGGR